MPPRTLAADTKLSAGGAFALNACFVAGLLVLSQLSSLQQRATVRTSIIVAALLLLAWPRGQHYLQACQQGAVILYWGYYWREVYHAAPLIASQLLFAYAFDSLLSSDAPAPVSPARQQGPVRGSTAGETLRARLRAGLACRLRDSIAGVFEPSRITERPAAINSRSES